MPIKAITIPLPSDVPTPRFQLFDRVSCEDDGLAYTVIGFEYVDVQTAIATPNATGGHVGWLYTISAYRNANGFPGYNGYTTCSEDCLEPVADRSLVATEG